MKWLLDCFPRSADSVKLVLPAGRMTVTGPTFQGSELELMNSAEGSLGAS